MDITRTGATMAATLLVAAVATPLLLAAPAGATYQGNDGRLYFGAFAPAAGNTADLYSTHIDAEDLRQLTDSGATRHDICPALSADGKRVALCSDRTGNYEIWTMDANGRNLGSSRASAGVLSSRTGHPPATRSPSACSCRTGRPESGPPTRSPGRRTARPDSHGTRHLADRFPAYSRTARPYCSSASCSSGTRPATWCPFRDSSSSTISAAACRLN